MTPTREFSHEVMRQAAAWYALLRDDTVAPQDLEKWQRWLDQRSEHRQAWGLVERVGGRFAPLQQPGQKTAAFTALQTQVGAPVGRRQLLSALGGVSLAGWLGWRTLRETAVGERMTGLWADFATATGEHQQIPLADGGQLWLNTLSAVDQRPGRLRLLAGEIQLQTLATLPLETPHGTLVVDRALLAVRLGEQGSCVSVRQGKVTVQCAGVSRVVPPGQQLLFTAAGPGALRPALASSHSWVDGVFVAEGLALGAVISELARYRHGLLQCAPQVAGLRVVGTFSVRDTDRALAALASVLPVHVERWLPWWSSVEARA